MLHKLKKIFKENFIFMIVILICILSTTIKLPYYIISGGGIIDTSKRIEIDTNYQTNGTINMAYVSEMKATPASFLVAKIKKYDVKKQEDVIYSNETDEDVDFRAHLMLEEANNNAIMLAYKKANQKIEILSNECFITYIDLLANTDLKIGDKIININNTVINKKQDVYDVVSKLSSGDDLLIKVLHDNKEYQRYAKLIEYDDKLLIGVMLTEKKEIIAKPNIKIKFKPSESGSSGGLMLTLAIYNKLIEKDITNGLKISGTGAIDEDGNVEAISGVKYKLKGAVKEKSDIFFVPNGDNYEEAIKEKKEHNYDIEIIGVDNLEDAINYLK